MSLKHTFIAEVNREINKYPPTNEIHIFEEADISSLPRPVQKYFYHGGFIGKPKMTNAKIIWKDVFLKFSPEKEWKGISCFQFNVIPEPARFAYMRSKLGGVVPFEGRDKYQDGHGHMLIKLLKIFTVADSKGKEMDESALVTVLAEALFIPNYALQPYIQWEAIDDYSARATLIYNSITVSGIFYFNEKGENIRFETADRNFTQNDGSYKKMAWSAIMEDHENIGGVKLPSTVKAVWHLPRGNFEYYKGRVTNIYFNIHADCEGKELELTE